MESQAVLGNEYDVNTPTVLLRLKSFEGAPKLKKFIKLKHTKNHHKYKRNKFLEDITSHSQ